MKIKVAGCAFRGGALYRVLLETPHLPPTQTPRALEMLMTGYYYDQASHASVSIGNTIR